MRAQFATELFNRTGAPRQTLTNMYFEPTPNGPREFMLRSRPGLIKNDDLSVPGSPIYLIDVFGFTAFVLAGTDVYESGSLIGSVAAGGYTQAARTDDQYVIVSGYKAYVVGGSVTEITDPDLPEVTGVVYANGVFVYPQRDTGIYYFSDVGDATSIAGLSFTSAEANPDPILRVETLGDELVFFGSASIEFHSPTNNVDAPFRRSLGRTQNKGCVAPNSVCKADNGIYFAGQENSAGRAIYRIDGGTPTKVSTPSIDALMDAANGFDMIASTAFVAISAGHTFYVISIPHNGTFAYDISTGKWAEWSTYNETTFRITGGSGIYYGDADGNVFNFDPDTYVDDTDPLIRVCSAWTSAVSPFVLGSLLMEVETGVSLSSGQGSDAQVEHRYTNDMTGNSSSWKTADLGLIGARDHRVWWRQLGCVEQPGRLMEFRVSDPVAFNPIGLLINEQT